MSDKVNDVGCQTSAPFPAKSFNPLSEARGAPPHPRAPTGDAGDVVRPRGPRGRFRDRARGRRGRRPLGLQCETKVKLKSALWQKKNSLMMF